MIVTEFIEAKKNGKNHQPEEIKEFVQKYVTGDIPEYQVAAWLMAVNFQGMSDRETVALVDAMLNSGSTIDLSDIDKFKIDKHSTGGVGDKVSLILAPLAQSAGCVVPMISGRGLGHSGGTLDKLESIPGFNVNLSEQKFINYVKDYGLAMGGQTDKLVPADRKMYSLRDVTSTVRSIPLICGSILSKKIAEGIDGLVLDVKTGNGAFLTELSQSRELAKKLKNAGEQFGLKIKTLITDMNQPLGYAAGNWLEVLECIDTLKGDGPRDLVEVVLNLTSWMVVLSGIEDNFSKARNLLERKIESGEAYQRFLQMVTDQGGDISYIENPDKYENARIIKPVAAIKQGYVESINTYQVGMACVKLGGGRQKVEDDIQPEVGIIVNKKIGEEVGKSEELAIIHANSEESWEVAAQDIRAAYKIGKQKVDAHPLIYETL
jgi:pyrimidine-nucleoside phosphorylase